MIDHPERELQGRIESNYSPGGIAVVAVQEVLSSDVREQAEAAGKIVFEDDPEAQPRDEVAGVQRLERMPRIREAEGVCPAESGIEFRIESLVDLAKGRIIEDSVHESIRGAVVVRIELSLIGRAGTGVVAIPSGNAQRPRIVEVVAERKGTVGRNGVPASFVVEERPDMVVKTDLRPALDGQEPAVSVLVGGCGSDVRPGGEPRRAGEQQRGKNGKIFFHDIGLFGE